MKGNLLGRTRMSQAERDRRRRLRKKSRRDIEREIYRQAGILPHLAAIRHTPNNLQRYLKARGLSARMSDLMTERQRQEFEAALSGMQAGRTSATLPERLVASWLIGHNYSYGGTGQDASPNQGDWGFQVPILGGRANGLDGSVADFVVFPQASNTKRGLIVLPQGMYYHNRPESIANDKQRQDAAEGIGYGMLVFWDYEALDQGVLNRIMSGALGGG